MSLAGETLLSTENLHFMQPSPIKCLISIFCVLVIEGNGDVHFWILKGISNFSATYKRNNNNISPLQITNYTL